jgi:hypothetical protein
MRTPAYHDLRIWLEEQQRAVLLGVGGSPSIWLTLDGFSGWQLSDSTYSVSVADPLTGMVHGAIWRDGATWSEINFSGAWQRVDIMISVTARNWSVNWPVVGVDFNEADGWSITWTPSGLSDGDRYYLHSIGNDQTNYESKDVVLAEYNCSTVYMPGDYDNDHATTIADLYLLVSYIVQNGQAPYGGAERADCNCDNLVNVADIIYYMNYLYGTASPPCR